ncbi:MAG: 3-hydroxyacyl-ACP dehydratase FabZ [Bacteroidaceae bacterium]|nr:3-hydroxyacyl-ACP dehydratase FabZ [Bacteroidaceae bacterium]
MEREEIKIYLPHRDPMLLVDSIVVETETAADGTKSQYAIATYHVRGDEYFLQGHFPDYPVVPGVILCEMMAQSCALLLGDEIKSKRPLYTGIDNVRFKNQVRPGDTIVIRSSITDRRQTIVFAKSEAKVDGKLCCRGNLSFALI